MIFRQFMHTDPTVAVSYLFGCAGQGICAVVDPIEGVDIYLRTAEETQMNIEVVIDTHVHADHVSGGRALAESVGASYVLHADVAAHYDFFGVCEGSELELGNVSVRVLSTPGHTPEHVSLLVTDKTRGADPWFVLTGHTLMVGDLGRTELVSTAEEGARALFQSIQKLMALPDYVEVYPGAFSGSVCGRSLSGKPMTTIGFERKFNKAVRLKDENAFLEFMHKEIPPRPPQAEAIRAINLGRPLNDATP